MNFFNKKYKVVGILYVMNAGGGFTKYHYEEFTVKSRKSRKQLLDKYVNVGHKMHSNAPETHRIKNMPGRVFVSVTEL